ncbi:MAG: acylneuraminate cytidylyltransferase [Rhodospirillales bacterium]|nr:MAG: acylneuraminate cytidylyltransferase [Rhodospirillales bacterium]
MSRVAIVLQARMGSTRLYGKVLKTLAGKPLLERIVDRLGRCKQSGAVIVATSLSERDDAVAALCEKLGVAVFRGSEDDVLDRYWQAVKLFGLDLVIRATGDNPFVDAQEVDRLVTFREQRGLDYVHAYPDLGSSLPLGLGAEIMTRDALERSWEEGKAAHHREHVNEYIQENPKLFSQMPLPVPADKSAPGLSFTVDTPEDFDRAERLMAAYMASHDGDPYVTTPWLIAQERRSA